MKDSSSDECPPVLCEKIISRIQFLHDAGKQFFHHSYTLQGSSVLLPSHHCAGIGFRFFLCTPGSEDPGKNHQSCNHCQNDCNDFLVSLSLPELRMIRFLFSISSGVIFFLESFIPGDCVFLVKLRIRIHAHFFCPFLALSAR